MLALVFMVPGGVSPVHAASTPAGEVCIAQPTLTTKCPAYPAIFAATTAGTAVDVNVNYGGPSSAQTFNTFDISVNVSESALNAPTTTTCSGPGGSCAVTVDPAFGVVAEVCVNGIVIVSNCSPTDGPGIVHVVAGSFNFVNNNQTLMTIHYASGTTTAAGVVINYPKGCTGTSTSDGTTCVTLVTQSGGSAPVSLETGYFASVATFFVTAFPSALTINGGSSSTSTANITAVNGLGAATVTMTATVSPAGPTANLASGTVSLTRTIQKATDLLTITVPSGFSSNFTVTVTGAVSTNVHSFVISVTVPPTPPSSLLSVVEGNGGALYWSMFTGTWSAWQSLSGTSNFPPALCSSSTSSVELVVTGTDGQLYHKTFSSGVWSSAWDSAGGAVTGQPSCAVLSGVLYVVAKAPDTPGSLWTNSRPLPTGSWKGWTYLNGASPNTPVLVPTPAANRLDVVVRGDDNRIWHMEAPGGVFSGTWDTAAGGTLVAPAAVSDGTLLHVVVEGQDGGVWYNSLTLSSNAWGSWTYLNGGTSSSPALALDSSGTLHIVVRGQNNGIYHDTKPSTGPPGTTWDSASGGLASNAPAVAFFGSSLVGLVQGSDNGLYFNTRTSIGWGTWASANGATVAAPVVAIV